MVMRIRITENQLKLILENEDKKPVYGAAIAQPEEEYLRKLFNSEVFKNNFCFSPEEIRTLKEERNIIINDERNKKYWGLIPDGCIPKYNYDKVSYKNSDSPILLGCKIHKDHDFETGQIGYFSVLAKNHKDKNAKQGCPLCAKEKGIKQAEKNRKPLDVFLKELMIDKPKDNHFFTQDQLRNLKERGTQIDDLCNQGLFSKFGIDTKNRIPRYCYDKVVYVQRNKNILIGCKIHKNYDFGTGEIGYFLQPPARHLSGSGCPKCSDSKNEIKISTILENLSIEYKRDKIFEDCFGASNCMLLKFDFYLPKYEIAIEYDGEYHFKPKQGEKNFNKQKENDTIKNKYCEDKGLKLLRIAYTEAKNLNNIITIKNLNNLKKGVTFIGKIY